MNDPPPHAKAMRWGEFCNDVFLAQYDMLAPKLTFDRQAALLMILQCQFHTKERVKIRNRYVDPPVDISDRTGELY